MILYRESRMFGLPFFLLDALLYYVTRASDQSPDPIRNEKQGLPFIPPLLDMAASV